MSQIQAEEYASLLRGVNSELVSAQEKLQPLVAEIGWAHNILS